MFDCIIFIAVLACVFGFAWFVDFRKNIPFKYPFEPIVKRCNHVNGLGEELPHTYTVWAKNIFHNDQPVFVDYQSWDWEGEYPFAKHFNSIGEVNDALDERLRNIITSSCKIVDKDIDY